MSVRETAERAAELVVGGSQPRLDARSKVLGQSVYGADFSVPDMLHGRPVLSLHVHARILRIDAEAALRIPGVYAVLTADDLPIKGSGTRRQEPLARGEVVFAGQPVALVVAESEAAAEDGVEAVLVEYEELPAVVDPELAIAPDAPPARVDLVADGDGTSPNVTGVHRLERGDVDAAFADCASTVEARFRTAWVYQSYLEPQVAVAWPEPDGGLAVRTSTQGVFMVRQFLARILDLPIEKVRVEGAPVGGAFGGKVGMIDPLVAAAALALGRPLRVALTRSEDFAAANPAPGLRIDLRLGARRDGTGLTMRGTVLLDTGAFSDASPAAVMGVHLGGPYRWDAWSVEVTGVRTNRFGSGPYRAPTAPQVNFSVESLVDELAKRLDLDPLELRRRNAAGRGDSRFDGTLWPELGLPEVLDAVAEHPLWQSRNALGEHEGVGLAAGLYPGNRMGATAVCRMDVDGGVTVVHGYVDLTGALSAVAAVAAETLGLPLDKVRLVAEDSAGAPHAGVSGGSMVTYCLGSAVRLAAADARRQILRIAAAELEVDDAELEIVDGSVHPIGRPSVGIPLSRVAERSTAIGSPYPPVQGHGTAVPPELAPSCAAALLHVRVDPDSGHVRVLEYVAIQDVGRAINRALCEGQMRGGAVQALGFALLEELIHDDSGYLTTGSFMNYAAPRSDRVPPIETVLVEVPSPHGPFGAKGIGESAIVPGAAAVGNAIAAATRARLTELPMTAERIWRATRSSTALGDEQG
jgi:CO/xanthine dehydrogenase Mo-binding subunit